MIKNINIHNKNVIPFYLADNILQIASEQKKMGYWLHITQNDNEALEITKQLQFLLSENSLEKTAGDNSFSYSSINNIRIVNLLQWDITPYASNSPAKQVMASRIAALQEILLHKEQGKFVVIIAPIATIIQKLLAPEIIRDAYYSLSSGEKIDYDFLLAWLVEFGYMRVARVLEPGEFAVRGDLIDIFPAHFPGDGKALRLSFFGNELENMRYFDVMSQKSVTNEQIISDNITITPASELWLNEQNIDQFKDNYHKLFGIADRHDILYQQITNMECGDGAENYLPLFGNLSANLDTNLNNSNDNINTSYVVPLWDFLNRSDLSNNSNDADIYLSFDDNVHNSYLSRKELIEDYYGARQDDLNFASRGDDKYNPLPIGYLYNYAESWQEIIAGLSKKYHINEFGSNNKFGNGGADNNISDIHQYHYHKTFLSHDFGADRAKSEDKGAFYRQVREYIRAHQADGRRVLLLAQDNAGLNRLEEMCREASLHAIKLENANEIAKIKGKNIGLAIMPIAKGFGVDIDKALPVSHLATKPILFISEQDIFGTKLRRRKSKRKVSQEFFAESSALQPGELIVHEEHGIGRFIGLEAIDTNGILRDCIKIGYAGNDKLFLPVENSDMISRYGEVAAGQDGDARLDKLGATAWQKRKAKLKERIKIAAEALLAVAAEREMQQVKPMSYDHELYEKFCAKFEFVETDDQLRSIEEVQADLTSARLMDRLICGDVGFGKTEIALRAAMIAALNKVQVAIICPTTLLARQHYKSFQERFADFAVNVAQLSRLVSAKEARQVKQGLADGNIDIVVGTHALLAKDIAFSKLGLVVVDEEQSFGVTQKEKLKSIKQDIHVLSLSATPIPRTLQQSLAGIRDLSLITTPPISRQAVRGFVLPYDNVAIKEAILREIHRGGVVFYVAPRISDLAEIERQLQILLPELRIILAHGQMAPKELDRVMNDFYEGKYDVLLSTSIIESGLDIAKANTIIIHRADMFGLAQLYQLRGRVGRSNLRAYAYFLLPKRRELAELGDKARKRLEVMGSLDSLGAGFTIASHDLDIRGGGNLLGEEQSGHIKEVGVELYQNMLSDTIELLKQERDISKNGSDNQSVPIEAEHFSPQINIGYSAMIPESYIEDLPLRIALYRRASSLKTMNEIDEFVSELVDRFGVFPVEVAALMDLIKLKVICLNANISKIDVGPKGIIFTFHNNTPPNTEQLLSWVARNSSKAKIRPDQKIFYGFERDAQDEIASRKQIYNKINDIIIAIGG